jgi:hypothetical protein
MISKLTRISSSASLTKELTCAGSKDGFRRGGILNPFFNLSKIFQRGKILTSYDLVLYINMTKINDKIFEYVYT